MADKDKTPPDAKSEVTDPKQKKPKVGDAIHVVTARGDHIDGEITEVGKDGTICLTAKHRGADLQLTRSPRDDTGKASDSWHFVDQSH